MNDGVFSYADPASPRLKQILIKAVETATGQQALKHIYLEHCARPAAGESFWQAAVRHLALDVEYDRAALERIPKHGPVVIIANHPYGVLDGIVMSWLIEKVRPDFRVLTHSLLLRAAQARPYLLPVDFSPSPEAKRINLQSRATARQILDRGGCVVIFPAGAIATAPDRLGRKPAVDGPWQSFTAQLIQRAKATVVPIHFAGQNSRLFQIASHLGLTIRLSLIFHEVKNKMGTALPVRIGEPIPFADLGPLLDRSTLLMGLRERVDALGAEAPHAAPARTRCPTKLATAARKTVGRLKAARIKLAAATRVSHAG